MAKHFHTSPNCGGSGGKVTGGGGRTIPDTTVGTYKFSVFCAYTQNAGRDQPLFNSHPQVLVVNVDIQKEGGVGSK